MAKKVNLEVKEEREKYWHDMANKVLKGRTIVSVKYISEDLASEAWWSNRGIVITLDNGVELLPMSDDEGNDCGAIHYFAEDGTQDCLPVLR